MSQVLDLGRRSTARVSTTMMRLPSYSSTTTATISCEVVLGGRHARLDLDADVGLLSTAVVIALSFTPTQTSSLRLIGLQAVGVERTSALIPFVYDDDDADNGIGVIAADALDKGAFYRLAVQDRRVGLVDALSAGQRDAFVSEFNAMGAVAGVLSPAVAIEFFSRQTQQYLSEASTLFADNPDLGRAVRRAIRETLAAQMAAVLDQDVGHLGTITLDNFLAYKAAAAAVPVTSPRLSLSAANQRLQQRLLLVRNRQAPAAWDPSTDALRSGSMNVRPMQKGSVVEIVTAAGVHGKDVTVPTDDDDDDDDDDEYNSGVVVEQKRKSGQVLKVDNEMAGDDDDGVEMKSEERRPASAAATTILDGVRHQFVLHSSSGQAIHTVWISMAKRRVVLASRGLLATRKTVIRFSDICRCDDGAARDANCFSIVTKRRDYHLQTSTARERDVWVAVLNEILGGA